MKIEDNSAYGVLQIMAEKLKKSPCIICDKPAGGFREISLGVNTAIVPLCDACKCVSVQAIMSAIAIHNQELPEHLRASVKTLR